MYEKSARGYATLLSMVGGRDLVQSLRPKGQCSLARDPNGLPVRVLKEWVTTHEEQCPSLHLH